MSRRKHFITFHFCHRPHSFVITNLSFFVVSALLCPPHVPLCHPRESGDPCKKNLISQILNLSLDSRLRGNDKGEYGNDKGEYGNDKTECGNDKGEYGNDKNEDGNDKGEYGNDKNEDGNDKTECGNEKEKNIVLLTFLSVIPAKAGIHVKKILFLEY